MIPTGGFACKVSILKQWSSMQLLAQNDNCTGIGVLHMLCICICECNIWDRETCCLRRGLTGAGHSVT